MKSRYLVLLALLTGCATTPTVLLPAIGGALGAASGAALSPNEESKSLNALTFGAVGLALGAGILYYSQQRKPEARQDEALKDRIEATRKLQTYIATPSTTRPLPDFLKGKISPIVIEELDLTNSQTEDGVLHEPHKAYRIIQQPELISVESSEGGSSESR